MKATIVSFWSIIWNTNDIPYRVIMRANEERTVNNSKGNANVL